MKFPSIKTLAEGAGRTIERFPFELLFALAGTIAFTIIIRIDEMPQPDKNYCYRVMMIANLGLLLSLSTTLFTETMQSAGRNKYMVKFIMAIAAASLWFLINPDERPHDYLRFFLFSLGFHLLVSFSAFNTKGNLQGFWQFNKILFLRFLMTVLYSAVLFLGLLAAINATIFLFNLKFDTKIDATLFAWIAGIFNTLFFLAGIPRNIRLLDGDNSYPKSLKIFTQYVLIPLATVYVLILLAYEIKLLIQWQLPKGMVSSLVLGYAVFGILSILLIYPIRDQDENKWIKTYSRSFYFLLIPLIILLFLAVFARIIPYGITEGRYFLLVLAFWLIFITGYFLVSKKQNIKIIPLTLCSLTFVAIYGPLSSLSISTYSQRHILINLFDKYGHYKKGKLVPLGKLKMTENDGTQAVAKLEYLINGRDNDGLKGYIDKAFAKTCDSLENHQTATTDDYLYNNAIQTEEITWLTTYLGLDKFSKTKPREDWLNYNFETNNDVLISVKGYDYVTRLDNGFSNTDTIILKNKDILIRLLTDTSFNNKLYLNNELIVFNLKQIADSLIMNEGKFKSYLKGVRSPREYTLPAEMLTFYTQSKNYTVALAMDKFNVNFDGKKVSNISEITGYYLIKKK